MISLPPTIPQARAVLAHYAPSVRIEKCSQHSPNSVSCAGSQALCVYHGTTCVPMKPIHYWFKLKWNADRTKILVAVHWDGEF